jgi:hypothetical protein
VAQLRDRKAELVDRARLQILHEDIGAFEHGDKEAPIHRNGEIEHHRFLAAIEPNEIAALAMHQRVVAAREVAFRPFDLENARARIGKPASTHRRSHGLFERNDEQPGQRESRGH